MDWFVRNPILLALAAAVMFGVAAPPLRVAARGGASPSGLLYAYGLGCLIIGLAWQEGPRLVTTPRVLLPVGVTVLMVGLVIWSGAGAFGTIRSMVPALVAGFFLAGGFLLSGLAYQQPTGYATIVVLLSSLYPVVGSPLAAWWLREGNTVNLWYLVPAIGCCVTGVFLTVMAFSSPAATATTDSVPAPSVVTSP